MIEADEEEPDDYPKVNFLVYRDLDTGDAEKDFLIEIDTEIQMVYGMYLLSSKFNTHTAKGKWKLDFNSNLGTDFDEIDINAEVLQPTLKVEVPTDGQTRTPFSFLKC